MLGVRVRAGDQKSLARPRRQKEHAFKAIDCNSAPQTTVAIAGHPRLLMVSFLKTEPWLDGYSASGSGMNSVSPGALANRSSFQSRLAGSILAVELETKFHQRCRSPSIGAPPRSITRAGDSACNRKALSPVQNMIIRDASMRSAPHQTTPSPT
jgi:hypothetical protein